MLPLVEHALDGQAYQVEFVDLSDEPYATVVAMRPDIIVVRLGLTNEVGFQLLSMLRLDPATAAIPVLSCVAEGADAATGSTSVELNPTRLSSMMTPRAQRH